MTTLKQKLAVSLVIIGASAFILAGCKREGLEDSIRSAEDNALAEVTFDDVKSIADEAAAGNLTSYKTSETGAILSSCATVTHDTVSVPHVLTIDFGTTNCTCNDGRTRRGVITVTYTGAYRDPGHVHTISFTNFFVNDNQVLGTKTVTNNGPNNNGNLTYSIEVNGSIIRADNGGTIEFTSSRVREWIEGEGTPQWIDDAYLVTGSASGTNTEGNSFSAQITSALKRTVACHQFVSGTAEVTPTGRPTRYIDFGNGTCDNQAVVTVNGHQHTIQLH